MEAKINNEVYENLLHNIYRMLDTQRRTDFNFFRKIERYKLDADYKFDELGHFIHSHIDDETKKHRKAQLQLTDEMVIKEGRLKRLETEYIKKLMRKDSDSDDEGENLDNNKRKVGRPKLIDAEERKVARQEKLKVDKYSTQYYQENKCRVPCQYCDKEINSLAKTSHYKSRRCLASRELRILTPN